ncbi:AAA family ATPase [Pontibacter sp. HSC-14F20]|uniref:McrB family protein n=1 Tax=Pontibacter sp. HSC-14F20 TaxID=2864136 RepID=UPI001C72ED75|nr:AAA family ATPase [Pontibacter sp. HSC-14F20]MBX0332949.1 AAA family ATPase [Pontibacter sp. HSC-14F20]
MLDKSEEQYIVNYKRFKKLLEYFVAHLEWVHSEDVNNKRVEEYIKPLLDENIFKSTGQGYKGANIQNQIKDWDTYPNGKIYINIQPNFGSYVSTKCYLNWEGTGINVIAKWNSSKTSIESLSQEEYQYWLDDPQRKDLDAERSIDSLGLFDSKENVTEALKGFFDNFNKRMTNYINRQKKNMDKKRIESYISLLQKNKNLILTGAPGTGKTFLAKEIAKAMDAEIEFVQFHPSYDYTDFVEGLRPFKRDGSDLGFELKDGVFKSFCKKAAKNLEDSNKPLEELQKQKSLSDNLALFIENLENEIAINGHFKLYGIGGKECAQMIEISANSFTTRSVSGNNLVTPLSNILLKYERYMQHNDIIWTYKEVSEKLLVSYHHTYFFAFLKAFDSFLKENHTVASDVEMVERKNYVIIIDEINRAEISKVFGELFFSLDPGYRGIKGRVKTQYSNLQDDGDIFKDGFYIPENVYVIGTMNDIDRSVESFDFAMRRRFAWKEIKATDRISMWNDRIGDWKDESLKRMSSINSKIESIQGLGSAFHIGPAYFLHLSNYQGDFGQLWENHLEGILFEYLRGLPDNEIRLKELKSAYNTTVEPVEYVEND